MHTSGPIKVLIADDHPVVRLGIEKILRTQPDMEVVGLAADGDEAVRQALRTRPDVIVLDVRMPVKDGLTALVEITRALPAARCLMLTGFDDPEQMLQALKGGAAGYLVKEASPEELLRAIRAVYHGEAALAPSATRQLIDEYQALQDSGHRDAVLTPT